MTKTYNNSGFSAVEVLLIVLIVAVLGGIGFIAWKNLSQDKSKSATSVSNSSSTKSESSGDTTTPASYQFSTTTTIASESDTDKLTGAPAGFVSFLKGSLQKAATDSNNCPDDPYTITVSKIDAKFARGGAGSCSAGAEYIWGSVNGTWQVLASTQNGFDCSALRKYNVSTFVAGDTCVNYDTHAQETYSSN